MKRKILVLTALVLTVGAAAWFSWRPGAWLDHAGATRPGTENQAVLTSASSPSKDSFQHDTKKLYETAAKGRFIEALPVGEQARVVKLTSRWLVPDPEFTQGPGREQVFVQVSRWLSEAEKIELAAKGLHIGEPFSGSSYRALLETGAWKRMKGDLRFVAAARVLPEDKLHRPLYRLTCQPDSRQRMKVAVQFAPGAAAAKAAFVKERATGTLLGETRLGAVTVLLSGREIAALAARPEVAWLGYVGYEPRTIYEIEMAQARVVTPGPSNEDAQTIHNVPPLRGPPYNLFGNGIRISEIDGGAVRATHEAFTTNRVTLEETNIGIDEHATHVAGTMIAQPPVVNGAQGIAPQATLFSYNFLNTFDGGGPMEPEVKAARSATTNLALVNNNSWGYVGGQDGQDVFPEDVFGDYDVYGAAWDDVVIANRLLVVRAAGNDRNDFGPISSTVPYDGHDGTFFPTPGLTEPYYDCISNWGVSKNIVTVGAVKDSVTGDKTHAAITDFSSIGPADDGRVKPDVVAYGADLLSTFGNSDTAYGPLSGTSMASPVVSGIAALVIEAHKKQFAGAVPDPALTKGILIHTAEDLGNVGPDYVFGWGLVNAQAAVDFVSTTLPRFLSDTVAHGTDKNYTILIPPGASSGFKVTLIWNDPAGPTASDPDLVNNLDLELIEPSGITHRPWVLPRQQGVSHSPALSATTGVNSADNVEQIIINNATATGTWTLRVRGTSIPASGGNQTFFLLGTAFTPTLSTPTLTTPATPTLDLTPAFNWTTVVGADQYELQVDDVTSGASISSVLSKIDITGTTHTFTTPLTAGRNYRARVRAKSLLGVTGPFSAYHAFRLDMLGTPTMIAPVGPINTTTPTAIWTAVTGAEFYALTVNLLGGVTVYSNGAVAGTSFTLPVALVSGRTYTATARALNSSGNSSNVSTPVTFTIQGGFFGGGTVPTTIPPNTGLQNFSGGGGGASGNNTGLPVSPATGNQGKPKKPKQPKSTTSSADRGASDSVAETLSMPVPLAPLGKTSVLKPVFQWEAAEGADSYELLVMDVTEGVRQVIHEPALTETKYTPKLPLAAGRQYRFMVRALSKVGAYSQVAPLEFSVEF